MRGWFKHYRDYTKSERWKSWSVSQCMVFNVILSMSNYKESEFRIAGEFVQLRSNQFATTISEICEQAKYTDKTVRRALDSFVDIGFIEYEKIGKWVVTTVHNLKDINGDLIVELVIDEGEADANKTETLRSLPKKCGEPAEICGEGAKKCGEPAENETAVYKSLQQVQTVEPKMRGKCAEKCGDLPKKCGEPAEMCGTFLNIKNQEYKNSRREEGKKAAPASASKRANPSVAKKSYAEHGTVKLTEEEYATFCARYPDAAQKIQHLEDYMTEKERTYANHFAVLCKWAEEDARKERARPQSQAATNRHHGSGRRPRRDKSAYASSDTRLSDIEEAEWIRKKLLHDRMLMMDEIRDNDSFGEKDVLLEPTFAACAVG